MKSLPALAATAFALAALSTAGCAEKDQAAAPPAANPSVVANDAVPVPPTSLVPAETPALSGWSPFKGYTFEQRDLLLDALKPLPAQVELQITDLHDRRAAMVRRDVNTADWDFAMQEMIAARSYLIGLAADLSKTPGETWELQKTRFGQGWLRTQEAYTKVRASTTS
jgi:hypothetical protein